MLSSEEQMHIIKTAIAEGYKGEIFKLIDQASVEKGAVAQTQEQQEQGLRGSDGNTAMSFPNSDQDFNTQGMDFDLDIRKYDKEGNLVKSYQKVPPGIKSLNMGEEEGTVIETPSQYQDGGFEGDFYPDPNRDFSIQVKEETERRSKKEEETKTKEKFYNEYGETPDWIHKNIFPKLETTKKKNEFMEYWDGVGRPDVKLYNDSTAGRIAGQTFAEDRNGFFNPLDNTIYIHDKHEWNKNAFTDIIIDELPHAEQRTEDGNLKFFADMFGGIHNQANDSRNFKEGPKMSNLWNVPQYLANVMNPDIQGQTYHKKGSWENDAHYGHRAEKVDKIFRHEHKKGGYIRNQYQDAGFFPDPNQDVGIQVDNTKKRRDDEKARIPALKAKIDKRNTEMWSNMLDPINVADAVGMTGIPVVSEAGDLVSAGISTARGNYTDAWLSMAGIAAPFAGGAAFKGGKSLYRVVDASGNVQAAKFGSTIPGVATKGRRTGYKDIQKNTDFDVLNTTTDQKWIAGSGPDDPNSLFNTYGGKNPYVVKIARGKGDETLDVINKRTNVLNDFQFPYTQNIGKWNPKKGQFDMPLELGAGVYTTIGKSADDLAKIPPGSIVNPNYLSKGNKNITTIFGPKGTKVRNVEGVMSKDEYLNALKKDPDFKFQKGGYRRKQYQDAGFIGPQLPPGYVGPKNKEVEPESEPVVEEAPPVKEVEKKEVKKKKSIKRKKTKPVVKNNNSNVNSNRPDAKEIGWLDRLRGFNSKLNNQSVSQSVQTYAQYAGNALLQGYGLVGEDESYFDVTEKDLRPDELATYKSMLIDNLNKGRGSKIDYRGYSNDPEIANAPSSEAARKLLEARGISNTLLNDFSPFSGTNATKEALHTLTGNASYTIDKDGNVYVQDNYDFNYSQNKKGLKTGTTISELYKHATADKYDGSGYDNAHSVGDQVKSRIPVNINLGSATDLGLTPNEIAQLGEYNPNASNVKTISTLELLKRGTKKVFGFQEGGFNPDHLKPTLKFPPQFPQGRIEKGASWDLKKGVRALESSNGVNMKNSKTPATGFYGQFFNQIKDLPFMNGVTRDEFAADTTLQNKVFDMRYKGQIPDVPGLKSNVKKLRKDYKELTKDYTDDELAALSNFTGRKRAREYFASIRDGKPFKMPGQDAGDNKSVEQYMKEFRDVVNKKKMGGKRKCKYGCW